MDAIAIIIFVGMVFAGFIIGYPLGHIFGRREAARHFECDAHLTYEPCQVRESRRRLENKDVLNAEVIE